MRAVQWVDQWAEQMALLSVVQWVALMVAQLDLSVHLMVVQWVALMVYHLAVQKANKLDFL